MNRLEGWPEQLAAHFLATRDLPGAWGERDCAIAFCDALKAITGEDLAADFRGRYSTELGAARILRKLGVENIEQFAERTFRDNGVEELPSVLLAQRGDAVTVDSPGGPAMGVVALDGVHVISVSLEGAVRVPLAQCRRAWRI